MHTLRLLATAVAACCCHAAQAVIVHPHPDGSLPGVSVAEFPQLAGVVVEDVTTPFSYQAIVRDMGEDERTETVFGTVQSQVVKSIDGSFDFYWRISNSVGSGSLVNDFRVSPSIPIAGAYHADYRSDIGVGLAPFLGGANPATGAAGWLFPFQQDGGEGPLFPGGTTLSLLLDTDATAYSNSGSFLVETDFSEQEGSGFGTSGLYATFAPAIPEPQTYALMLVGLGLLGFAVRHRQR